MANEITASTPTRTAVAIWAQAVTAGDSLNRKSLVARKIATVNGFFDYVELHPLKVQPADVLRWQQSLEARGLAQTTIYAILCHLSSFYAWLGPQVGREHNPVEAVRPKPPKPYQGPTVKALKISQVRALLRVVRSKADAGDIVGKRDYAMLLFYFSTAMRRNEVARLSWGDTDVTDDGIGTVTVRLKGGSVKTKEVKDDRPWRALFDYLEAAGRLGTIGESDPLWARHDAGADGLHDPVTSRTLTNDFKAYSNEAGIDHAWLHQSRHTVAQWVAQHDGVDAAQELLGHQKRETTLIYTGRLTVQRDRYSKRLLDEFLPED